MALILVHVLHNSIVRLLYVCVYVCMYVSVYGPNSGHLLEYTPSNCGRASKCGRPLLKEQA